MKKDYFSPNTYITNKDNINKIISTSLVTIYYSGYDNYTEENELLYSTAYIKDDENLSEFHWSTFNNNTSIDLILDDGLYTFYVRTKDLYGNIDQTSSTVTFRIDITPPTVVISASIVTIFASIFFTLAGVPPTLITSF